MASITIALPDTLKSYGAVSEYFRSLLRDAQEKENEARLEALLLEWGASGKGKVPDAIFWAGLKMETAQLPVAGLREGGAR